MPSPPEITPWQKLEQQLADTSSFDRLLEQEEEMELESFQSVLLRPPPSRKSNGEVRWLQQALNKVSAFGIAENGVSSLQTKRALQKFQAEHGFRPTGTLGPKTRRALMRASGIPAPRPQGKDLGDDFEAEMETPSGRCPLDSPYVIRGFSRYSDDVRLLPPDQQKKLAAIAAEIVRSHSGTPNVIPITRVVVVGHDDQDAARESREPGFLQYLSEKRAAAVGLDLTCRAVNVHLDVVMAGQGAGKLAVSAPQTEAERACNRRVEIVLERPSDSLPRLDLSQSDLADRRSETFRTFYHIALQGTSGQYAPPVAEQKAREIAERVVPFLEARVKESSQAGCTLWSDVLQLYFQDALQGTASKYPNADEAISKAYDIARHSFLVVRQAKSSFEWKAATLPQPMAADCEVVHGKVPGPANYVLCAAHGHILDTSTNRVIAHDLDEYKKQPRR